MESLFILPAPQFHRPSTRASRRAGPARRRPRRLFTCTDRPPGDPAPLLPWLQAALKSSAPKFAAPKSSMPNTTPTPSEDAEDQNGGDEGPTIAALLETMQREGGELIDAAGRNVAVKEGFAWIVEALAKRGLGKGAVAEGEEEEKGNDARGIAEEQAKRRAKEDDGPEDGLGNEQGDGLRDGVEDGLNAAVAWILEAVAKRRKEGEAAEENVEESDRVRVSEEETAIQRDESGRMSTSPLSWITELLPGNIRESAPSNDPELAEGDAESRSEELVPAPTTEEAENQLVSWLSSHLSPTATKEEVLHETVSWISSNLSSASENLSTIALQDMLQRGSDVASQLSNNAMLATLSALNVEPFDTIDNIDDTQLPRHPYDPVHALTLAGYSFRAYLAPPSSSYREAFAAPVDGSELSGLDRQLVYTDFVYPSTEILAQRAKGAVMLQVVASEGLEGEYVVVEMNGVLVLDVLKKRHCAMLCQRDPPSSRFRSIGGASDDELVINAFPNEKAYVEGSPPSDISVFSLADFVRQGLESGMYVDAGECSLKFEKVLKEEKDRDFFHFSLLPKEMRLPFPFQSMGKDSEETDPKSVGSASITLHLSFIPFLNGPEGDKMTEVSSLLADAEATSFQTLTSTGEDLSISSVLKAKLSPGQLPDPGDWRRLAGAVRNLVDDEDITLDIQRTATLTEDLPSTLFIESLATDTQVWLFHDKANKDVVISFRGTEQVSWKDFFTDAQMFLQLWVPGVKIDLNVDKDRTVGLVDLLPGVLPSQKTSIPTNASAIHYGFLRAYLSIRDALIRGLKMVSSDFCDGYSFHFTGHSLGGALAIIASADLQARQLMCNCDVSCMTFGAPKVGNVHFAKIYNELVPNAFRIVNDTDLVARMPRSISTKAPVNRYQHAGRTVLISDDGDYWIEGHNNKSIIMANMSSIDDPFRERYKNLQDLINFERNLWNELISGRSVQHHMEDAYFTAMSKVLRKFLRANRV